MGPEPTPARDRLHRDGDRVEVPQGRLDRPLSLVGLIFPQEEAALWPSSSPHCRAPVFFDVSSGNELLDLRAGTADVGWDQLYMPREETVDAHRYLHSAVEFMQAVDGDDPVSALVAWAGHLRRDLRRALARRRSKEDADARPESP